MKNLINVKPLKSKRKPGWYIDEMYDGGFEMINVNKEQEIQGICIIKPYCGFREAKPVIESANELLELCQKAKYLFDNYGNYMPTDFKVNQLRKQLDEVIGKIEGEANE